MFDEAAGSIALPVATRHRHDMSEDGKPEQTNKQIDKQTKQNQTKQTNKTKQITTKSNKQTTNKQTQSFRTCENFLIDYYVGEGDSCFRSLLLGAPATVECMTGLRCDRTSAKCVKGERSLSIYYFIHFLRQQHGNNYRIVFTINNNNNNKTIVKVRSNSTVCPCYGTGKQYCTKYKTTRGKLSVPKEVSRPSSKPPQN